jgi:hypothetical protein
MKKTIIRICSIAAIGLALTACNNDAANKKLIDADNSAIDQLVQDKIKTLDDSLDKACADQVLTAATAKVEAEAPKGGKPAHATTTHHTTTPAKKDEPKSSGKGGFGGAVQDQKNGTAPKQGGFGGAVQDQKSGTAPKQGGFGGAVQDAKKKGN